jgi:hypothetical protein
MLTLNTSYGEGGWCPTRHYSSLARQDCLAQWHYTFRLSSSSHDIPHRVIFISSQTAGWTTPRVFYAHHSPTSLLSCILADWPASHDPALFGRPTCLKRSRFSLGSSSMTNSKHEGSLYYRNIIDSAACRCLPRPACQLCRVDFLFMFEYLSYFS